MPRVKDSKTLAVMVICSAYISFHVYFLTRYCWEVQGTNGILPHDAAGPHHQPAD